MLHFYSLFTLPTYLTLIYNLDLYTNNNRKVILSILYMTPCNVVTNCYNYVLNSEMIQCYGNKASASQLIDTQVPIKNCNVNTRLLD